MPGEKTESVGAPGLDYSLVSFAEILFPCLDAAAPASVIEVGAYKGDFTGALLEWAAGSGARVAAIDPDPPPELLRVADAHPELELVRAPSHEALAELPPADALIIDGDHNHYTLSEELRLIDEQAPAGGFPLILFHDVCWPHARRDTYYAPERIPEQYRQPLAREAMIAPGESGTASAGILYPWAAAREGGPKNGVLTAIEDFLEHRSGLRLAIVPAFFGLGVLWPEDAPWADTVANVVAPWDRSALVARLEADRVQHIVDRIKLERQQVLLRAMLNSRAFAIAERISSVWQRGEPVFSRDQVRRALGD
ncbi:MAG: class I SAM-dependent methyltransferase [Actinobacteria bacterium]|nr:class I SAM-dependent methyltransferase [Actinomycetota bacterium]